MIKYSNKELWDKISHTNLIHGEFLDDGMKTKDGKGVAFYRYTVHIVEGKVYVSEFSMPDDNTIFVDIKEVNY